jgi:membrane protein YdbS with pleckstrin-like domain
MSEFSKIELWFLRILRVPPDPKPPEGSPDSIQIFHAGRNFYTWCLLTWLASHLTILAALIAIHFTIAIKFLTWPGWAQIVWRIAEPLLFVLFAGSAFTTFFSQRLNYRLRWYMVTDRSLRIRAGILSMEELTMTFSNIQEIRLSAGPIQNLLQIANVEVHSAGGSSGGKGKDDGHMGCFEGVSNANAIRDLMVERLRQYRDSGLGEAAQEKQPAKDHAIDAARAVLAEARSLRQHLTPSASA